MANILGIFTAIILAVAAFVAVKNKARLSTEIDNRADAAKNLTISQDKLKASQEVLKQLPIDRAEIESQATAKTEEQTAIQEATDELKSQIESKTATISSNKEELDVVREKIANAGNISELADKMKNTGVELAELDQSITNSEATLANLTAQNTSAQAVATQRKTELDTFKKGDSLASLNTRIRSIYPAWGFVTLAEGNNGGVIANSVLNVVRGDETVARLLVTAVESRSATASIIPDSMGEDVTLMVGDRVVPGSKEESKPASN